MKRFAGALVAAMALVVAPGAMAQTYPSKTVHIIVPWAPGGLVDTTGRVVSDHLARVLGQPVVVENKPGATGNIGADAVAKAEPDGHTLLVGTSSLAINAHLYERLPFDPAKDFAPVALVANAQSVIVVHPSVPAGSVGDLIALAKAKPGALTYGSPGNGSPANVFAELFKMAAGIDILHVPYNKSPAMNDLISGHLSLMFANMAVALPNVRSGRVRALAVTGASRSPALPDVPTVAESGLPGYEAGQWVGILAPAGTPHAVIELLNREVGKSVHADAASAILAKRGMEPRTAGVAEFQRVYREELDKWGKVIKATGIRIR